MPIAQATLQKGRLKVLERRKPRQPIEQSQNLKIVWLTERAKKNRERTKKQIKKIKKKKTTPTNKTKQK